MREWDELRQSLRLSDFRAYISVHQLVGPVSALLGEFARLLDDPVGGVALGDVIVAGVIDQPIWGPFMKRKNRTPRAIRMAARGSPWPFPDVQLKHTPTQRQARGLIASE